MNKEFKLIVAGGRDFTDYPTLIRVLNALADQEYADKEISIVSGMARGADALGTKFAKEHEVKLYEFPANWNKYGKSAGYRRNEEMGNFADGLLAFWDGESKGTKNMIEFMRAKGKPVHVFPYSSEPIPEHMGYYANE